MRRHVLYLPGYAPVPPRSHHSLFTREAALFAALWGVEVAVSPLRADGAESASWTIQARQGEARAGVIFEILRWDDLIADDFRVPLVAKLAPGVMALVDALASGTLLRVARAAPWFAAAWIYPYVMLAACVALGAAAASFAGLTSGFAMTALALGVAYAVLAVMRRTPLFVVHLLDDWIAQRRYRRRADVALDARVTRAAARIAAVVAHGDADEVLVVGHSSGAMLALDAVARALDADPDLAEARPLTLLTVGNPELLIALHPDAGWRRKLVGRLARAPSVLWVDVVGRWDMLCFPERSIAAELGLPEAPNLMFRRVSRKRLLSRATIADVRRRIRIFRTHFQYVMANELQAPYDFLSLVCGDRFARAQFARPVNEPMAPFAEMPSPGERLRAV